MHHTPLGADPENEVRRCSCGRHGRRRTIEEYCEILRATYPGDVTQHSDLHIPRRHAHSTGILEDAPPTIAHTVPANDQLPTWMDTLDPILVQPDRLHCLQIAVL